MGRDQFQGLAGAFRYQISKGFAFASRLEWYQDRNGFITGKAHSLKEATGTLEYKVNDWSLFRFEYRHDQSDQPYFDKRDGSVAANNMNTLLAALVVYWGPKK